jgi:hypothetical protein
LLLLLALSCGGGTEGLDQNGLAAGGSALGQFARAGQLYFRGSLSASREEFNGVIYRFPDSPLAEDARLAVRRIEGELREGEEGAQGIPLPAEFRGLAVTVVGQSAGRPVMEWVSARLTLLGCSVNTVFDSDAPEVTVVLHRQGFETVAGILADSLSHWLSRPQLVEHQGGGGLIDAVEPGCGGVMIVVGTDAILQ